MRAPYRLDRRGGEPLDHRRPSAPLSPRRCLKPAVAAGFARVGVADRFAEGGSTSYLQAKYGLDAAAIVAAFRRASTQRDAMRVPAAAR